MKPLKLSHLLLLVIITLFIASCGKKGDPTLKTFEKPVPVKEIKAVHREDKLIISWSYPASERLKIKGFYIKKAIGDRQEAIGKRQEFKNIAFLKSDASQFVDKDFKIGQTYFYTIRVRNLEDIISDRSPVITVKPLPLPEKPTGLRYSLTEDSVVIKWDHVRNGVKYNIYKSYEKGKYPASPLNTAPLIETYFIDKVEKTRAVYYTVRALLGTDIKGEGYPSEELEVNPESFVPSKPANLSYVPSEKKVYLIWDKNPETWVRGYRIYRKKASESEFKLIGESILPTFIDNEPLSIQAVYYVTAIGPKKESIPSDSVVAYPLPAL
jgi:hypothetical protein